MLDRTYQPAAMEARRYALWERSGAFAAAPDSNKAPYTIMMPPPNVTGSLHMGHALTFTLQDVLVRYQRMRGRDVLWQPGTDHAGIAAPARNGCGACADGSHRPLGRDRQTVCLMSKRMDGQFGAISPRARASSARTSRSMISGSRSSSQPCSIGRNISRMTSSRVRSGPLPIGNSVARRRSR